ncbi:MAG: hypothetical protein OEY29_13705 [Gammaproteobacteria bacterium]|nr:hypothetical protein [Gammaproteobacteria bacterium]
MKDIGSIGEDTFKLLCSQADIIINESVRDRTGWDFFIEFPTKPACSISRIDNTSPPIECKIQVKSTNKKERKVTISLSVMHRLIMTQMPVFICLLQFDNNDSVQSMYMIPIDNTLISRTLKRIRSLDIQNKGHKLNKSTLTINFEETDQLPLINGKVLKKIIETHVSEGMTQYIYNKNSILKTSGYENSKSEIKFEITSPDPLANIIDLSLGLKHKINVKNTRIFNNRFGIKCDNPDIFFDKGHISIESKHQEITIRFKESLYSKPITFDAKFFTPMILEDMPEGHLKYRIKHENFDLIFSPKKGNGKFNFTIDYSKDYPLSLLNKLYSVLLIFKEGSGQTTIEIDTKKEKNIRIHADMTPDIDFEDILSEYNIFSQAYSICRSFNLNDDYQICLYSLYQNKSSINSFHTLNNSKVIDLEFNADIQDGNIPVNMTGIAIFPIYTNIGNNQFCQFIALICNISHNEKYSYNFKPFDRIFGEHYITNLSDKFDQEYIDKNFKHFFNSIDYENSIKITFNTS